MIRAQITLGLLLILAAMTIVLLIGINEPTRLEATALAQRGRSISRGADLFVTNCSRCHGEQGQGIPGLCPPLNDPHFFAKDGRLKEIGWSGTLHDYVVSTIKAGRAVSTRPQQYPGNKSANPGGMAMPMWGQEYAGPLRPDQVEDIANFILNWEPTAGKVVEIPQPKTSDPVSLGKTAFQARGCAGCHNVNASGAGGLPCPNLGNIGNDAVQLIKEPDYKGKAKNAEEYLRESILEPNVYIVKGYQPSVMPQDWAQKLGQDELNNMVQYLLSLKKG